MNKYNYNYTLLLAVIQSRTFLFLFSILEMLAIKVFKFSMWFISVAVVIMFFVCWAPFHAQRLLYIYAQKSDYYPDLNEWLYIMSGCLYYFSTTVNPILYNVISIKYRQAFKQTICCKARQPASKASTVKKSHSHRCDSLNGPHDQNVLRSIRYESSKHFRDLKIYS